MFQYGIEGWGKLTDSTFVYLQNLQILLLIGGMVLQILECFLQPPYLQRWIPVPGRPVGHWADQDSQIVSVGGFLLNDNGTGWGTTLRNGDLNEDGNGRSSVSDNVSTDYFSVDIFNSRQYPQHGLSVHTSLGWESLKPDGMQKDDGFCGFLSLKRTF